MGSLLCAGRCSGGARHSCWYTYNLPKIRTTENEGQDKD